MASGQHDGGPPTRASTRWSSRATLIALAVSAVLIALASAIVSRAIADRRHSTSGVTTPVIAEVYPAARRTAFLDLCRGTGTSAPRCGCLLNEFQRSLPLDALAQIEDAIRSRAPLPSTAQTILAACTARVG
jgi:hypothetical protein